jgi:hypothetical protein
MKNNRRKFLTDLGKLSGVLLFSGEILDKLPAFAAGAQQGPGLTFKKKTGRVPLDFHYAPASWQTTYSYPMDGNISLIDKYGTLLIDPPGTGHTFDAFGIKVAFGLAGKNSGEYIEQKLESPETPVVTTRLKYDAVEVKITSFASRFADEGRVDNHLFEITPGDGLASGLQPAVIVTSAKKFALKNIDAPELERKQAAVITSAGDENAILCIIDGPAESESNGKEELFKLSTEKEKDKKTLKYFIRFPREKQSFEMLKAGLRQADGILADVRSFWQTLVPADRKTQLTIHPDYEPFLTASFRNILQVSELGPKKRIFHSGPTLMKDMYPAEAIFMIEALRFMGYDKEAQEGLETIWNLQDANGSFPGSAGPHSLKDTAAAVYALGRNAHLTQDYDYFNELFPDAYKAISYLQNLQVNAYNEGKTLNGKYQLLPRGTVETGIDGDRAELTNTFWTMMAIPQVVGIANKFYIPHRVEMRDLMSGLVKSFIVIKEQEMKMHPKGFKYLPMLLPDDPMMKAKDKSKRPAPQFAQYALTKALFPGLVYRADHDIVAGHLALMSNILEEDVPAGTGMLGINGVETYHAAALAQFFVWMGEPELAVRTFRGFLNHASPLYSWRGEQSLQASGQKEMFGDMPHSLAAAECILYLRNSLLLEDIDRLLLLGGLVPDDILANRPIRLSYSPTRWGRVSIALEPVDEKTWTLSYKREEFKSQYNANLERVEFPRHLTKKLQLDKIPGINYQLQGSRVYVEPNVNNWIATFRVFG